MVAHLIAFVAGAWLCRWRAVPVVCAFASQAARLLLAGALWLPHLLLHGIRAIGFPSCCAHSVAIALCVAPVCSLRSAWSGLWRRRSVQRHLAGSILDVLSTRAMGHAVAAKSWHSLRFPFADEVCCERWPKLVTSVSRQPLYRSSDEDCGALHYSGAIAWKCVAQWVSFFFQAPEWVAWAPGEIG